MASVLLALALGLSFSGCDPREWFVCSLGLCGYELDDVPPQRPRQLVATPGNQMVTLSWSASEPDAGYEIGRSTTPGGPYIPQNSAGPGFVDTYLLANGTTYYYVVTARDGAGNESPPSIETSATPRPDPPPPALPAPQLSVFRFFDHLRLEWTGVTGAKSYNLYRGTTPGGGYDLLDGSSLGSYFDRAVTGGTKYYYVVAAVDSTGQQGAYSNEVSESPESFPGPGLGWLLTWGSRGQQPGAFWDPRGIATDPSGNVYVTDNPPEVSRVQKFTPIGGFMTSWQVGVGARGIAVGPDGSVYVVSGPLNRVQKYTSAGVFVSQWGSAGAGQGQFSGPTGIAVDSVGNVYVADTGHARIQKFDSSGSFARAWTVSLGAVGVATDAAGDVYVVDRTTERVRKYTRDGAFLLEWGEGGTGNSQFDDPEGIAVDNAARVFVADTGNDRMQFFSTAGVLNAPFGRTGTGNGQYDGPTAVASDCAANLYILDAGNSRVQRLGPATPTSCAPLGLSPLAFAAAAAARGPGFQASMTTTRSTPGVMTGAGGVVRERGAGAVGRFTGRLVGRATRSTRAFRVFSRGTWKARYDIVMDPRAGKGTAKGVVLATPARRGAGRLCIGFDLKIATAGAKVTITGSFSTLAGPGSMRGTFTQTLGKNAGFTLRGAGTPGRSVRRALPKACRALV